MQTGRTSKVSPDRRTAKHVIVRLVMTLFFATTSALGLVVMAPSSMLPQAQAHASLEETTPTAQADLAETPKTIRLVFNEGVQPISGSIRLIREDGTAIELGRSKRITNGVENTPPALSPGAYVVAWRVVSDDGHPIRGAFTFRVGGTGNQQKAAGLATAVLASGSKNPVTGWLYNIIRFLRLVTTFLFVGLAVGWFVAKENPPPNRLIAKTSIAAFVMEVALLLLYGPFVSGQSISAVTNGVMFDDTLHDPVSKVSFVRLAMFGVLAVFVRRWTRPSAHRWLIVAAAATAIGTQLFPGHGTVGRWRAIASVMSFFHIGFAAMWIGGLLWLGFFAFVRPSGNALGLAENYSRLATVALFGVVVTGAFANFRQVGSLRALRTTDFGRVLLIKLALVSVVGLLGLQNRRSLSGSTLWQVDRFRRAVSREAVLGIAVLAVTTMLTGLAPARDVVTRPYSTSIERPELIVDITAEPARRGSNELHFYALTPTGAQLKVESIRATASLAAKQIEDLELNLKRAGSNHFQVLKAELPVAGKWTISVSVNIDEFTEIDGQTTVVIR